MLRRILYYALLLIAVIAILAFLYFAVRAIWQDLEPNGLPQSLGRSDISSLCFFGIAIVSAVIAVIMNFLHYS